jgi:hypothetical protein
MLIETDHDRVLGALIRRYRQAVQVRAETLTCVCGDLGPGRQ